MQAECTTRMSWLESLKKPSPIESDDYTIYFLIELRNVHDTPFKQILSCLLPFNELLIGWEPTTMISPTLTLLLRQRRCLGGATDMKTPTHCWR